MRLIRDRVKVVNHLVIWKAVASILNGINGARFGVEVANADFLRTLLPSANQSLLCAGSVFKLVLEVLHILVVLGVVEVADLDGKEVCKHNLAEDEHDHDYKLELEFMGDNDAYQVNKAVSEETQVVVEGMHLVEVGLARDHGNKTCQRGHQAC